MIESSTLPEYDNSFKSHACTGENHVWMWGGDIPDWPYDGMPCSCGAVKYDKRQALRDQIAELHRQLVELDAS